MRVLVTGATGFVGGHLVKALVENGHHVRCLVRRTSGVEYLTQLHAELVFGDVLAEGSLQNAVQGIDVVYHLVGGGKVSTVSETGYLALRALNVTSVRNVLDACSSSSVRKFILFSSTSAIGVVKDVVVDEGTACHPKTPHELVKHESEQVASEYCSRYAIPLVVIRPTQVYGPGDTKSEILRMCKMVLHHCFLVVGDGRNVVPMVYVGNVVHAALLALANGPTGTFIVTDEGHSMNDTVTAISRQLGIKRWGVHVPKTLAKLGISPCEFAARLANATPIFTRDRVESITSNRLYSIAKAQRELGYQPLTQFDAGIAATIGWYKQNGLL